MPPQQGRRDLLRLRRPDFRRRSLSPRRLSNLSGRGNQRGRTMPRSPVASPLSRQRREAPVRTKPSPRRRTLRDEMAAIVLSGRAFLRRQRAGRGPSAGDRPRGGGRAEPPGEETGDSSSDRATRPTRPSFAEIIEPCGLARNGAGDYAHGKVQRNPQLSGTCPPSGQPLIRPIPGRAFMHPIWDFDSYCAAVAQADINLSVLAPSLLTERQEARIKWMEAAMFAIPSVVSPTATHRDVVGRKRRDRDACRRYRRVRSAILSLVDDPSLRQRIGEAARQRVLARLRPPHCPGDGRPAGPASSIPSGLPRPDRRPGC